MVVLVPNQQLRTLVVAGADPDVVVLFRQIKLPKSPIDDAQLPLGVVDHDILRFDVTMHDTQRVTVVQPLENLIKVVATVHICELRKQSSIIHGLDMLKHQAADILVSDDIEQLHTVVESA